MEFVLEKGGDTEFKFHWNDTFLPGIGDTQGSTKDYILAIKVKPPNLFEARFFFLFIVS